ncbi:MAG: hypothetical protein HPY66_0845 [Firmicutes bacterium]|nr:hypothetical protein [Bacillota bacterium]MDI6706515.1 NusG domain II-containing protein [Bacillota bacterium]
MTRYDKILVAFVLLIAVSGMLFLRWFRDSEEGTYAVIYVNGEEYKRIDLRDEQPGELTVQSPWGYNTIEIGKNRIRIKDASCPDKLCVKEGWLSRANEMAVCMPNRVYVKIIGGETEIDDVAY